MPTIAMVLWMAVSIVVLCNCAFTVEGYMLNRPFIGHRINDRMYCSNELRERRRRLRLSEIEFQDSDFGSSLSYTVTEENDSKRLDTVIATVSSSISRSVCGVLIAEGHVAVNGKIETRKSFKVARGMQLVIDMTSVSSSLSDDQMMILPEDLPLSILYEDEYMIVVNKAAGMVVHPAVGNYNGTLVNALAYYLTHKSPYGRVELFEDSEGTENLWNDEDDLDDVPRNTSSLTSLRPGIVHRLDKGTTGVLIVAKTRAVMSALAEQFRGEGGERAEKIYLAITVGNPGSRVVIDRPIGRHPIHRQRMRVVPDPNSRRNARTGKTLNNLNSSPKGRRSLSFVDTLAFDGKLALAKVRIVTGRTHQIRVHLQDRNTPVYGDDVYGIADWNKRLQKTHGISRPLLHAFQLTLRHPVSEEVMTFRAPLPEDMRRIIKAIYPQGENDHPEIFTLSPSHDEVLGGKQ